MKTRHGFVSNSSSSSFIIKLEDITGRQLKLIQGHSLHGKSFDISYAESDPWNISVTETQIEGTTCMDNFDMHEFLEKIGVPESVVEWGEFYG